MFIATINPACGVNFSYKDTSIVMYNFIGDVRDPLSIQFTHPESTHNLSVLDRNWPAAM